MLILYGRSEGEHILKEQCRIEVGKTDNIADLHALAIVPHYGTMYVSFAYLNEMMQDLRGGHTVHAFVTSSEMKGSLYYTMLWSRSYVEISRLHLQQSDKVLDPKIRR